MAETLETSRRLLAPWDEDGEALPARLAADPLVVLAYVGDDERRAFARAVHELGAVWLSNEGDRVLRCIGVGGGDVREDELEPHFLLVRDGHDVLARADPHGVWLEWAG